MKIPVIIYEELKATDSFPQSESVTVLHNLNGVLYKVWLQTTTE